jgi:hypothetical protein
LRASRLPGLLGAFVALSLLNSCAPLRADSLTYGHFTVSDASGSSFLASGDPLKAFEAALDIWNAWLPANEHSTIRIEVAWAHLGSSILGSTDSTYHVWRHSNVWYPDTLADYLAGADLAPTTWDMSMQFSSDFKWYYGATTPDPTAGTYDFESVALHEIAHGMGITGNLGADGSYLYKSGQFDPGSPWIYDTFVQNAAGVNLTSGTTTLAQNASYETSALYWGGAKGNAANKAAGYGSRAVLYAPTTFNSGSSVYHLNDATYETSPRTATSGLLMEHAIAGQQIHRAIDPILTGMLEDMGWQSSYDQVARSTPEAPVLMLVLAPAPAMMALRRRPRRRRDRA